MGGWKSEHELPAAELPVVLRQLAQALEGQAQDGHLAGLPAGWHKLVLVAERRRAGVVLKLKAKPKSEVLVPTRRGEAAPEPGREPRRPEAPRGSSGTAAPHGAGREKYRQLKKAMQAEFKALLAEAQEGRLPRSETVESFVALAEAMAAGEQPAGGAAQAELARASQAFLDDCRELRAAFAAKSAEALSDVLSRLARRKSACHAQFR